MQISPQSMTGVALVLRELGTNSANTGRWDTRRDAAVSWTAGDMLFTEWSKRGGPVQTAAFGRGFVSILIKRTVEGQFMATIDYRRDAHGLDILIRLPMHAL